MAPSDLEVTDRDANAACSDALEATDAMSSPPGQVDGAVPPVGLPVDLPQPPLNAAIAWELLHAARDLIWVIDRSGLLHWSNAPGYDRPDEAGALSTNFFDRLPPDVARHRRLMVGTAGRTRRPVQFVDQQDGRWYEVTVTPTSAAGVFAIVQHDIDRRVTAEEQLKRVLVQAERSREDERRRIARDLHDETGQALTGLILGLRNLGRQLKDRELRSRAEEVGQIAETLMGQTRMLLHRLNPPTLTRQTLSAAMAEYCRYFSKHTGLTVEFEAADPTVELDEAQSTALYRLLQESLTNVARHAEATTVWVSLEVGSPEATLSVEDNGIGFRSSAAAGSGITGLRDRFAAHSGTVDITSEPGKGTRIEGSLPTPVTGALRIG